MQSLLVAIATFNRPEILEQTLRSVTQARIPRSTEVHLFDDASTRLSWPELTERFPVVSTVHRAPANRGADGNLLSILAFFAGSPFSRLLLLDSDCLVRGEVFEFAAGAAEEEGAILSTYRSAYHSERATRRGPLVEKVSLGALGMLLGQAQLGRLQGDLREPRAVDWQIVRAWRRLGGRFLAPERSLVQHIGWHGTHNAIGAFDRAVSFEPTNDDDRTVLARLEELRRQHRTWRGTLLDTYKSRVNSLLRHRVSRLVRGL